MNNNFIWAVCYTIPGCNFYDGKSRENTVAAFRYYFQAEEFIDKCLPEETKEIFYIKNMEG